MENETVFESSGNVFADLGIADAESHLLKARLVHKLAAIIKERGLTQTAAAKLTGSIRPFEDSSWAASVSSALID